MEQTTCSHRRLEVGKTRLEEIRLAVADGKRDAREIDIVINRQLALTGALEIGEVGKARLEEIRLAVADS